MYVYIYIYVYINIRIHTSVFSRGELTTKYKYMIPDLTTEYTI